MTSQIKKLSVEEIEFIKKLLKENNVSIVTQKLLKEVKDKLNLNRLQLKRRATAANYSLKIGYSWHEINDKTPGKGHITLKCQVCNKEHVTQLIKLKSRTYSNNPLCPLHYRKVINESSEWREKNRQAQIIAQNRPEVLEKQSLSQKRRHSDPLVKEAYKKIGKDLWKSPEYAKKVSLALRKKWEDIEYANKVLNNSKNQYHGTYNNLKYQSLVELSFILWMENVNRNIKRYNLGGIKWKENKNYYPDFIIDDNIIVEVKGGPDGWMRQRKEEIIEKQKALINWCNNNNYKQRLVFKKDIPKEFYSKARKVHGKINS